MSSTQNANGPAGRPQKRARDEGDETDADIRVLHVPKYQAVTATAATVDEGGLGISANSPVAQNECNRFTVSSSACSNVGAHPVTPLQSLHFLGVPPAHHTIFGDNNDRQSAIPSLQPAAGDTAFFQQQLQNSPLYIDLSNASNSAIRPTTRNAPSAVVRPTKKRAASASISQRSVQQHRVPAAAEVSEHYYQAQSSASNPTARSAAGPPLDRNAAQPARAAYSSNLQPTFDHQNHPAGNSTAGQIGLHSQAHQVAISARTQGYRPDQSEWRFFNNAVHQLRNPLPYVPGIPISSSLPLPDRILYPLEILNVRFLSAKERYLRYAGYCESMTELYGPSQALLTPQRKTDLMQNLIDNSAFLRDAERRQLQQWQNEGVLKRALEDCARPRTLTELELGPADVPKTSFPNVAATATHQNSQGSAPPIYMPNINRASSSTFGGGHNGYSSPRRSLGDTREALAFPQPGSNPRARPIIHPSWESTTGMVSQAHPSSSGFLAPPTYFHQQGIASYEGSSSAPILIDEDDEPARVVVSQHFFGLNQALKRGPPDEQPRPAKIARTAAYSRPIDPSSGSDVVSASLSGFPTSAQGPSPASQSSPPARKTFENSEGTKEFEAWAKQWEEEKKMVECRLPGHLDVILQAQKNRGDFKFKSSWLAFIASGKREWQEREKVQREAHEKEEKLKARRNKEAAKKSAVRAADQAEEKKVANRKARREERRLAREENTKQKREEREEREAAARKEQEDRETYSAQDDDDSTQEPDELSQALYDALANSKQLPENHIQEVAQPPVESKAPDEMEPESGKFDDLFEEAEETLVSPNSTSTEGTSSSAQDEDEMSSLFGDDEDGTESPATSLNVFKSPSEVDSIEHPEPPAATSSREPELAGSQHSGTDASNNGNIEDPAAEISGGDEDVSNHSDDKEEDPEIASKRAEMRVLDEQIAERTAQLFNTLNALFKKRVQVSIDKLFAEKESLERQIRRLVYEKRMAEIENEGGL